MQFTRLRLLGFKSFVDPTELHIAPGLTGVVGPNGCGKSNLLEALRWVMGESRPSVMRGDGMEDVIFAGSGARPARGHAEVTLTLDNSERRAPAGFNDDDTLEIVRRITRDAGSAYRANGREARARDVQILFADASTGSHSPSLVRQGQIAELINAKPKARRRVLEEAAGISGLYQRRHEAELKLRATEANLGRVGDVLEALETQLASLARQARQSARYREIAEALRRAEACLLIRLWRDSELARAEAASRLIEATGAAGRAQAQAAAAARERTEAEEALPDRRERDAVAAAILQRLVVERDRLDAEAEGAARTIAGLEERLNQVALDRTREADLDGDALEMERRLSAEDQTLRAEHDGHDAALSAARAEAGAATEALRAVETGFEEQAEAAAKLAAETLAAERMRDHAARREEEAQGALGRADQALAAARDEAAGALRARAVTAEAAERGRSAAEAAEARLDRAEVASAETRAEADRTRAALSEAAGTEKALASEIVGVEQLLMRAAQAGAQILDEVTVAPGWEAALGAALADDLAHPAAGEGADGWRELQPFDPAATLPAGAEALAAHVRAPAALARRLAAVGVVDRATGARLQADLQPGQRLTSREGDLWRWDGLTLSAGAAPSAATARLRQKNRLSELAAARAAAARKLAGLGDAAEAAAAALRLAEAEEAAARMARRAADQAATAAARDLARAESAAEAVEAKAAAIEATRGRRAEEIARARAALEEAKAACAGGGDAAAAKAALEAERVRVEAARLTSLTRRAAADELDRDGAARVRRLDAIYRERETWRTRRETARERLGGLDARAERLTAELDAARGRPAEIATQRAALGQRIETAETGRRAAADALAAAETALRERDAAARAAERAAGEAREGRARAEALAEAAETQAASEAERLRAETEREPEALIAELGVDVERLEKAAAIEATVARLRSQRDGLGAVNLRAEEDSIEIRAEFDGLSAEKADLEAAVAKLRHGIANLNREGRQRLLVAFDEVNRNFGTLFTHLFGGGEATLALVESDDPLEAGLEIMCQPPGKKLSTLSLLSGGEQTLTALSLIFAVFLANPAPICVLDEVDAPLDDANVGRFCDLLDEMTERTKTRFLIITHHAVTMARMDRLFGVTMAEQGVSQLVSVNLQEAERIVEPA